MRSFPKLKGKAILAPMAGVTDVAFRHIARTYGASLTYTEFISSAGLSRGNEKTKRMLHTFNEKPSAVQIFGNNEKELLKAAEIVEKDFDIIDINLGCPADKVLRAGAGSALLKDKDKIKSIISTLSNSINKPITVKTRLGFKVVNILEVAKVAEKNGAAAITIHGRLANQGYNVKADWSWIKKVKENVSIPVIGNGDINSPETAKERLEYSGVDYVMIGRAAIGNPFLFKQINDYLEKNKYKEYATKNKIKDFFKYISLAENFGIPFSRIKKQAQYFSKGIKGGARVREMVSKASTISEIRQIFNSNFH